MQKQTMVSNSSLSRVKLKSETKAEVTQNLP